MFISHWRRPWCWEGLGAGGEGCDRGWDGWLASLTRWMQFEWTPGVGEGHGGLACCDSWGHKELDTTEWLNWTEQKWIGAQWPVATTDYWAPLVCQALHWLLYMWKLSFPNNLWGRTLIPNLLIANPDPQKVNHFQEITLPLVTKLRFDKGIWLFIMQEKEGIILTTESNDNNWKRWVQGLCMSVRIVCKIAISRLQRRARGISL